jgi:hypothetical protein
VAAKIDANDPESVGQRSLRFEEPAMGHQAVEEDERPPFAFVLEGDARTVGCPELPQSPSPAPRTAPAGVSKAAWKSL